MTMTTDPADAAVKDGVMIALLPTSTDWCNIELPHMTLVYAGLKKRSQTVRLQRAGQGRSIHRHAFETYLAQGDGN